MSGGYQSPSGDGLGPLLDRLREIDRRLSELENPTGTSMNSLVAQVQEAIAAIGTTIDAWLEANSYTAAEIDVKIASPGNIAPGTVSASGGVSAAGQVSGNTGVFNGGLKSTDVYSRSVTYGGPYTATWTHQDGTMGTAPSSERFKQDIALAAVDVDALERAEVVNFRYIDAVENLGPDAEVRLGGIAEQFIEAGLGHAVTRDEDGLPFSIEDRPLIYTLLAGYQALARRVGDLEAPTGQTLEGEQP